MKSRLAFSSGILIGLMFGVLLATHYLVPLPPQPPKLIYTGNLPVFVFESDGVQIYGGPRDFHVSCTAVINQLKKEKGSNLNFNKQTFEWPPEVGPRIIPILRNGAIESYSFEYKKP